MSITRRQFLKRAGAVVGGSFLAPGLASYNPFIRQALAETLGDRYFVVVFLDGGNDGLGTVIPTGNGGGSLRLGYDLARLGGGDGLRILPSSLTDSVLGADPATGEELAFNPALRGDPLLAGFGGLHDLYTAGRVALIQGCGYPEHSLSHDEAQTACERGDPLGAGLLGGWMGRYLAANYTRLDVPAVTIDQNVAKEFEQSVTNVIAARKLSRAGFPFDLAFPDDIGIKTAAFLDLHAEASATLQSTLKFIGDTEPAIFESSERYPELHSTYRNERAVWDAQYDEVDATLAKRLREVAKVIYGVSRGVPGVDARFFEVRKGGFDTHADQGAVGGRHSELLVDVGAALKIFYDDCADMGVADQLCIVIWTEFSRRIAQNENGSDHGSQGPMFVIGGKVNGGIYGNHPNIDPLALNEDGNTIYTQLANPFRSTDFRDVYGTLLKHWLGMPHSQILSDVLTLDVGHPAIYWTAENFDLSHPTNAGPLFLP